MYHLNKLTFLTRDGCVNTARFLGNIEKVLDLSDFPAGYEIIDIHRLPASDNRRGYPTPTLLCNNRDIFGMEVPQPPFAEPG